MIETETRGTVTVTGTEIGTEARIGTSRMTETGIGNEIGSVMSTGTGTDTGVRTGTNRMIETERPTGTEIGTEAMTATEIETGIGTRSEIASGKETDMETDTEATRETETGTKIENGIEAEIMIATTTATEAITLALVPVEETVTVTATANGNEKTPALPLAPRENPDLADAHPITSESTAIFLRGVIAASHPVDGLDPLPTIGHERPVLIGISQPASGIKSRIVNERKRGIGRETGIVIRMLTRVGIRMIDGLDGRVLGEGVEVDDRTTVC